MEDVKDGRRTAFLKGITRNVIILGLVSMFTDLSSQMVFPLIPLFLVDTLGAGATVVGVIEGAAEATASLLKVVSGYWSDKIKKRKPFILAGYGLSTITKPLFSLASTWPLVLLIRSVERVGKGLRNAPRDAVVSESTSPSYMGKAYGFQRSLDALGSMLGALIAFALLNYAGLDFRQIFAVSFIPGLAAVALILFIKEKQGGKEDGKEKVKEKLKEKGKGPETKESKGKREAQGKKEAMTLRSSLSKMPLKLWVFIAAATIFTLGNFGYAFLLLKAKSLGFSDSTAILLYVIYYSSQTVFSIPAGMLSDKAGRKRVLMLGYALFGLASMFMISTTSIYGMVNMFIVFGIFLAIIDANQRAFVADLSPAGLKATSMGVFHTATGIAALPAGYLIGLIWDSMSPSFSFLYCGIMALAALVVFTGVKEE